MMLRAKQGVEQRRRRRLERLPARIGWGVAFLGLLVLLGWAFGITALKSILPHWVAMKSNTAAGLLLSGLSLWLVAVTRHKAGARTAGKVLAVLVSLLGGLSLLEHLLGGVGIRQWMFQEEQGTPGYPGRMSVLSALSFLFLGLALLQQGRTAPGKHPLAHFFATFPGVIGIFCLVKYLYGIEEPYGISVYTQMALHTGVAFGLLAFGIFCLNLDHSYFSFLLSQGPEGLVARAIGLSGVALPVIFGALRVAGERWELFPLPVGSALYTTAMIVTFTGVGWWTAVLVHETEEGRIHSLREQERMKAEAELKERFVSMLAHDLRTPLTAAKLNAQMIEKRLSADETGRQFARRITDTMDRTDSMIRDLLDVSRIQTGRPLQFEAEEVKLEELIQRTAEEAQLIYGREFRLDLEAVTGYWSRNGLRRTLENLFSNGAKYGAKGTPVKVHAWKTGPGQVAVSVHNEGPPIPAEEQRRIFEPFRRSMAAGSGGEPSWGIGLALVKGTAEAHGGKVELESRQGKGTTFTLRLPLDSRPHLALSA